MRPSTFLLPVLVASVASASRIAVLPRTDNYDLLDSTKQAPMPQLRNNRTPASMASSAESIQTCAPTHKHPRRRRRRRPVENESAGDRNEGLTARQVVGAVAVAVLVAAF